MGKSNLSFAGVTGHSLNVNYGNDEFHKAIIQISFMGKDEFKAYEELIKTVHETLTEHSKKQLNVEADIAER